MTMVEQIGAVNLKGQLVAAHSELRKQLIRSREMRARMDALTLPERMDQTRARRGSSASSGAWCSMPRTQAIRKVRWQWCGRWPS
jgi:hypothetical protein